MSCCWRGKEPSYNDSCVDSFNHTVNLYRTVDFSTWHNLGVVFTPPTAGNAVFYRPHVRYCAATATFVMWYKIYDPSGGGKSPRPKHSYGVAVAASPAGPPPSYPEMELIVEPEPDDDEAVIAEDPAVARLVEQYKAAQASAAEEPEEAGAATAKEEIGRAHV